MQSKQTVLGIVWHTHRETHRHSSCITGHIDPFSVSFTSLNDHMESHILRFLEPSQYYTLWTHVRYWLCKPHLKMRKSGKGEIKNKSTASAVGQPYCNDANLKWPASAIYLLFFTNFFSMVASTQSVLQQVLENNKNQKLAIYQKTEKILLIKICKFWNKKNDSWKQHFSQHFSLSISVSFAVVAKLFFNRVFYLINCTKSRFVARSTTFFSALLILLKALDEFTDLLSRSVSVIKKLQNCKNFYKHLLFLN